jgi:tRNA dimethylallyltransferase
MGPTAAGKSALALEIAERCNAEIISVDSAAIYQAMNAGTAKPTSTERAHIPHHLIDIVSPLESYSVERFRHDTLACIQDIHARGKRAVLAGGTMMYFKALLHGLDAMPEADPEVREKLDQEAKERGWPGMHARLKEIDPLTAARLDPHDSQRIQRALEVYALTGQPLSSFHGRTSTHPTQTLRYKSVGLMPLERSVLHERIAQRFDLMLQAGLVEECRQLQQDYPGLHPGLPSMRCVGYRQALECIEGKIDADQFRFKAIVATRQLAKRQMTWMRSLGSDAEIDPLASDAMQKGLSLAQQFLEL